MVRIEPTIPPPASITQTLGPNALLPIGKVLSAVVFAQRAGDLYELLAGDLRLLAESKQPLKSGEQLLLRVTGRDAQQRPMLETVSTETTRAQTAPWLREALPRQQDATRLLATLWQLGNTPTAQPAAQHPALQYAAQLLQQLPSRQQLTDPQTLQRVLQQSGLFLEAQLQRPGAAPDSDVKALLLQILRALGGKPRPSAAHSETQPRSGETPLPKAAADTYSPRQIIAQRLAEPAQQPGRPADAIVTTGSRPAATTTPATSPTPTPGTGSSPASAPSPTPSTPATANPAATAEGRFTLPHPQESLPGQVRPIPRAEPLPPPIDPDTGTRLVERLARETDSSLARIESHQLLHIDRKEAHSAQWLMELPVRDKDGVDLWQVHVTREDGDTSSERGERERRWHIVLSFDFPDVGPVLVKLEQTHDRLFVAFHSESARTDALIAGESEALKATLQDKGIAHVQIAHRQGLPAPETLPQSLHRVLEDQA